MKRMTMTERSIQMTLTRMTIVGLICALLQPFNPLWPRLCAHQVHCPQDRGAYARAFLPSAYNTLRQTGSLANFLRHALTCIPRLGPAAQVGRGVPTFMQSLNRTQLSSLVPLLTNRAQETVIQRIPTLQTAPLSSVPDPTAGRIARQNIAIGSSTPPAYQPSFPAITAAEAEVSHRAQLLVPLNGSAGVVRPQNTRSGSPLASGQSIGGICGPYTDIGSLDAIPAQVPLQSSPPVGVVRHQDAQRVPLATPAITVSQPTSIAAKVQPEQSASGPGPQSLGSIRSSRLQQFMATQGFANQPRPTLASPSIAFPNNSTLPLGLAQPTFQNSTLFASQPALNPINIQSTRIGVPSNPPTAIQHNSSSSSPRPLTLLAAHLGSNLTLASPQSGSPHGIPIQIYVPKIVVPNTATPFTAATDCLLLGYTKPGTQILVLSKAIFLPVSVWENTLNRVRNGHYTVLETYPPPPDHPCFASHSKSRPLRNPLLINGTYPLRTARRNTPR